MGLFERWGLIIPSINRKNLSLHWGSCCFTFLIKRTNSHSTSSLHWGRRCCFTFLVKRTNNHITSLSLTESLVSRCSPMLVLTKSELPTRAADAYLKRLPWVLLFDILQNKAVGREALVWACGITLIKGCSSPAVCKARDVSHTSRWCSSQWNREILPCVSSGVFQMFWGASVLDLPFCSWMQGCMSSGK